MSAPLHMPATADLARVLHARRQLEAAVDNGTALLAALGLPRLVEDGFVPVDREAAAGVLADAVALLDAIDAPGEDLEAWLGAPEQQENGAKLFNGRWIRTPADQRHWADGGAHDREGDVVDEPHDEDTDRDETAPERHGKGFVRCGPDDHEDDDPCGTDESGIADLDGYHEQCGYAITGALPWSVGGYIDG